MWIQPSRDPAAARSNALAVPIREIPEINLGPDGEIDDRFVIRYTRNSYVQTLLGEEIWAKVSAEIKKDPHRQADRAHRNPLWAFWRDCGDDHPTNAGSTSSMSAKQPRPRRRD